MAQKTQRFEQRQSMNGMTYEVFHYLDFQSRHLEAHYHDFYEVFVFLDGDVDYWIDGSVYHLMPGDILLMNPMELHKPIARADGSKYERIVLWLNKSYLSTVEGGVFERCFDTHNPKHKRILRYSAGDKNPLLSLAKQFVTEYYSKEYASEQCAYGVLLQILTQINRLSGSADTVSEEICSTPTFISEIVSYINAHYREKLSLDTLADHFYINKYYLSHEFKNSVGTSLYRYITLKRLNAAYDLLREGMNPSEVSGMCGFGDYTSFYRSFKSEYGISPAACAKEH